MPRFERADCPETPFPVPALENARCGFLIAPEDRSKPNGRTIRSAVAIVPAESDAPAPDPVVYMAGGPGAAAILQTQLLVDLGFNRDRDLIVMAQRATLFSRPQLSCREYDRVRSQVHRVYDSASFGRMQVAAVRGCRRDFAARGIDVGAYNATENAADFADLRRLLGIAEWNVFGFSYGTDLALTYMRDHPEGIRSFTIDSEVPPHLASLSRAWISVDEAFHNLFRACAARRLCDDRYPRLGRTFAQQVRKLEADPLRTRATPPGGDRPVRVMIDGGTLVNWLVHALDDAAPSIPSAIHELANGNPRQIAEARAALAGHPESLGLFGWGLAFGVVCGEWVPYEPASEIVRQGRRAFPSFPRSVLAQAPQFPFFPQICRGVRRPDALQLHLRYGPRGRARGGLRVALREARVHLVPCDSERARHGVRRGAEAAALHRLGPAEGSAISALRLS